MTYDLSEHDGAFSEEENNFLENDNFLELHKDIQHSDRLCMFNTSVNVPASTD